MSFLSLCAYSSAEWTLSLSSGTFHPITRFIVSDDIYKKAGSSDVLSSTQLNNRLQISWENAHFFAKSSFFSSSFSTQWRYFLPGEETGETYLQSNTNRTVQASFELGYKQAFSHIEGYFSIGFGTYLPFNFNQTEAYQRNYFNQTGNWSSSYQKSSNSAFLGTATLGLRKQIPKSSIFLTADLSGGFGFKTLLRQSETLKTTTQTYQLKAESKGDFLMLHLGIGVRIEKKKNLLGCVGM